MFYMSDLESVGYGNLVERYALKVIPHYRLTYISATGRGSTHTRDRQEVVILPKSYSLQTSCG